MPDLPTGTVTFLFTDLEGSTGLWQEHPDAMKGALARHDELVREAIEAHRGTVVKTTGDGFHAAFAAAHDAVNAAVAAQLALAKESWGEAGPLRVRMGIHSGPAELRDGDYYGTSVNRAARLMSAAHGGQIVLSLAAEELVAEHGVEVVDLGVHSLRDLARPEQVFQVMHPDLPRDFPRIESLEAFPGNLPAQVTSFVGRDAELATIAERLEETRLVTLTGVGGVGKTRLSLQVAAEVLPRYRHGAWFCELAAAVDEESLLQVVTSSLGFTPLPGTTFAQSIIEFLRSKSLLLVLDNCEHLLDEVSRLAGSIVRECPAVQILASSREGLGVPGELMVAVRSLSMPSEHHELEAVAANESVQLFVERAAASRSGFSLDQANVATVAEICRRLDGIPLAIELAAARVSAMNPSDIAAHLDERFRLLTGGRRTGIERHQTLRATVDWSYSLLEPAEQTVFDRLGVFAGDFDAEAAQGVVSGDGVERWDVLDALAGLVAKSMITIGDAAEGAARYRMLETLRAYSTERLDETGELDHWRRRHAEHYAELADRLGPELLGRDEIVARRRFRVELDNIRAAVTWALDSEEPVAQELGVRIVLAFGYEVALDRRAGTGVWAEHALRSVQTWEPRSRTGVVAVAAMSVCMRGDVEAGRALVDEAFEAEFDVDAPVAMLHWTASANVALFEGDLDEVIAINERAIDAFDAGGGVAYQRANVRSVAAHYRIALDDRAGALTRAEESLALAREAGNPSQLAISLTAVGAAHLVDDPQRALAALEESVELTRAGASDVVYTLALIHLATLRAQIGDARGTLECLREAFERIVEWGDLGTFGSIGFGVAPLVQLGFHELALTLAAGATFGATTRSGTTEAQQQALAHAQSVIGVERADALMTHVETMAFDEMVDHLRAEMDRAIASR